MKNWLHHSASKYSDRIAVYYKDKSITYSQLLQRSQMYADKLHTAGIRRGDHVGVFLRNSILYVYIIYALIELGAVFIPLNTRLSNKELVPRMKYADVQYLLADQDMGELSSISVYELKEMERTDFPREDIDPKALHSIIFTSGTTSHPKAVMLSYENHYSSARSSAELLGIRDDDAWLNCIPLYHVGGLEIVFRSCINGTSMILMPSFNEDVIREKIVNNEVSMISVVPTMFKRLYTQPIISSRMRCILIGGAHTPGSMVQWALQHELPIAITYGMTETCSQAATATTEILEKFPQSVGFPLKGMEIKINLIAGETYGEILVKGEMVTSGYYKADELNRVSFVDGYFKTGDLGYFDGKHLVVLQRRTDLIISGGENIVPSEVEQVLISHNAIKDAIVFGMHDDLWGQRVVAAIIIDSDISFEELEKYCRLYLAGYKVPREYRSYTTFPQNASGKIIRDEVKKQFKDVPKI
ncbi:MAG: o-succinylbenzoate--CoA ligase [Candidatus Heimdallarchaeota archaeon]|nr:o-succinylbenzoate--CoA ligase [Candidatus Heimdallarchaeota archaeon]